MTKKAIIEAVITVGIVYAFFYFVGVGCPIKFATGVSCAGCGMTRAWLHAAKLEWRMAFTYHPLFWLVPVVILILFLKNRDQSLQDRAQSLQDRAQSLKRQYDMLLTLIGIIYIALYLYRLIDPADSIVVIDIEDGMIYRCFTIVWGVFSTFL